MQQINLYSEILKEQQSQSGLRLVPLILAAALVLCLSFSAYLLWDVSATKTKLHQAQLTFNQQKARVNWKT
jgi:hypothetical protein